MVNHSSLWRQEPSVFSTQRPVTLAFQSGRWAQSLSSVLCAPWVVLPLIHPGGSFSSSRWLVLHVLLGTWLTSCGLPFACLWSSLCVDRSAAILCRQIAGASPPLGFTSVTQSDLQTQPGFSFPGRQHGNSLRAVSGGNPSFALFVPRTSGLIVLHCLISSIWQIMVLHVYFLA